MQFALQTADQFGRLFGLLRRGLARVAGLDELPLAPADLAVGLLRRRTGTFEVAQSGTFAFAQAPRFLTAGRLLLRRRLSDGSGRLLAPGGPSGPAGPGLPGPLRGRGGRDGRGGFGCFGGRGPGCGYRLRRDLGESHRRLGR
ncbi:hypothetical protein ACWCQ0_47865, partial [Streptomyces massasporeus]